MACKNHDKDYLKSLEEAYPLSQVEREAKEMTERAQFEKIQGSEQYAQAVQTVGYLELNEKLNDTRQVTISGNGKEVLISETLNETAEQAVLAAKTMATMPIEFMALAKVYKGAAGIQTKPTNGGAYNCRNPKYKTKKRR